MKKNFLPALVCFIILSCFFSGARADTFYMYVDGQNYTNGQTANIPCNKSSILCRLYGDPVIYFNDINTTWDHSSNFSITDSDIQSIITLNLDPNMVNGSVTLHAGIGNGVDITVYITQKPEAPSFSSTPNLCFQGQSGTYSVTFPTSGNNPITGIFWGFTNGITVNGSNAGGYIDTSPSNGMS